MHTQEYRTVFDIWWRREMKTVGGKLIPRKCFCISYQAMSLAAPVTNACSWLRETHRVFRISRKDYISGEIQSLETNNFHSAPAYLQMNKAILKYPYVLMHFHSCNIVHCPDRKAMSKYIDISWCSLQSCNIFHAFSILQHSICIFQSCKTIQEFFNLAT